MDKRSLPSLATLRQAGMALAFFLALTAPAYAAVSAVPASTIPWWFWPLALFITCFFIGIVAVTLAPVLHRILHRFHLD